MKVEPNLERALQEGRAAALEEAERWKVELQRLADETGCHAAPKSETQKRPNSARFSVCCI
jgi:hypothetical protein